MPTHCHHLQRNILLYVPSCLRGMWNGNTTGVISKALQEARITHEEFYACWSDKVNILIKTECGKKQLVALLKKGGFDNGLYGSPQVRLRRRILFVKEVVGRDTSKKAPPTAGTIYSTIPVCLSVWVCV